MNIYLMRHFKVDFVWEKKYNSKEFKIACEKYDNATIINQNVAFEHTNIQIYISELIRSSLTHKALKTNIVANKMDLINEIPIVPFIQTKLKLPTVVWMIVGRIQWFLNIKKQPETRRDTNKKIKKLIRLLEQQQKDTLIIGHGFYFFQFQKKLKKMNYSGNRKSYYKNGDIIIFNKTID